MYPVHGMELCGPPTDNLSLPRSGDSFLTGDIGLVGDVPGFLEGVPLRSLAEKIDSPGCRGFSRQFGIAPAR